MKVSVYTPVHKKRVEELGLLKNSLLENNVDEWVVVLNGDILLDTDFIDSYFFKESWITVIKADKTKNIGYLKDLAVRSSKGDILIEVDYDDYLTQGAVNSVKRAFEDNEVKFAYSNCVDFLDNGDSRVFSPYYGWESREFGKYKYNVSFPPKAQYLRRIEWSPNHLRAFKKDAYLEIGGYDTKLEVGDDHDLVCRFYIQYGERGMKHIDECLYMYKIHEGNTSGANGRIMEIQAQVDKNYVKYSEKMYMRWAEDEGLLLLDLGGRFNCPKGYKSVDLLDADYIINLEEDWTGIEDNSVGVLRAYHVIEHLKDPIHFFNEAFRVLAPGGFLLIEVPSSNGMGGFSDPTHISFFNTLSFEYYTNEQYARFIRPMYKGRFQKARVVEYWWDNPRIPIVGAHLIALKGWYDEKFCGEKLI